MNVDVLREAYRAVVARDLDQYIDTSDPSYTSTREFAIERFEEGVGLAAYFRREYPHRGLVILDVGAGSGGVALGLASDAQHVIVAVDLVASRSTMDVARAAGVRVHHVVASADFLPFRHANVDVVLCLETIEHLHHPRAAASQMMRVLRTGGQIMITTPSRVRFLFRPDPHR